ncbi:uncharacterized protein LOC130808374 [Amaranthus tricolor]|uniref:uncharacterized protein LOC130808374 n=1 Tax=Amaranthus tricolor TaxID=29722 RepID=UPI002585315A|nr:uncharacterized protein LOC130808374 [Amaranthus tricolor]
MGTTLLYSTSFHSQTDGQKERTNQILEYMLRAIAMDWQGSPVYWNDFTEAVTLGLELLFQMTEKVRLVRDRLKVAQDRQKSYADLKRRPEEFIVGERVGKVAYRLALPNSLEKVHDVFHVSQLKRYHAAASHVLDPKPLDLDTSLSYSEKPVRILDTKVRSTRRKDISMVKVLWSNHKHEAATWETEDFMRAKYPHLFQALELYVRASADLFSFMLVLFSVLAIFLYRRNIDAPREKSSLESNE